MDKRVDKQIGMIAFNRQRFIQLSPQSSIGRGSRFENVPRTSQDRAKIDVLLISPAHSEFAKHE